MNFVNFCCPVSPVTSISVSQCPAHPQQLPCHMLGPGRPSHPPQGTSGKGQCKPAWSQHVTAGFKPNGEANSVETGRCAARKHTVSLIPSPPMIPSYVGLLAFFPSCLKSKVCCKSCACDAGDMCSMRPSVSNHEKRTKKLPQFLPHPAQNIVLSIDSIAEKTSKAKNIKKLSAAAGPKRLQTVTAQVLSAFS